MYPNVFPQEVVSPLRHRRDQTDDSGSKSVARSGLIQLLFQYRFKD